MDEDEEESAAVSTITAAIQDNSKLLHKAIVRKNRALQALSNADRDISVYSGAIMALEDVQRRLKAPQKEAGAPPQVELPPPSLRYITLSGERVYHEVMPPTTGDQPQ